jgi:tRNA-specific 2-thiouridylase
MSGGVDSSVSAAILKEQGYNVVGVFIRTWHPDFLECNEEEERIDAMRVASFLDIPFLTFNFEDIYKKEVADYMIGEYKNGRNTIAFIYE